jgi:hypothetical protein
MEINSGERSWTTIDTEWASNNRDIYKEYFSEPGKRIKQNLSGGNVSWLLRNLGGGKGDSKRRWSYIDSNGTYL